MLAQSDSGSGTSVPVSTSPSFRTLLGADNAFWDHSEARPQLLLESCPSPGTHSGQLGLLLFYHRSANRRTAWSFFTDTFLALGKLSLLRSMEAAAIAHHELGAFFLPQPPFLWLPLLLCTPDPVPVPPRPPIPQEHPCG